MQESGFPISAFNINKLKKRVKLEGMCIATIGANIHTVPSLENCFQKFQEHSAVPQFFASCL
jgi:hypothetical protein